MQMYGVAVASDRLKLGAWLVLASAVFNVGLCFINTRHWTMVTNAEIIVTELMIMTVGLVAIRDRLTMAMMQLAALTVALLIGMKLINPTLNLKILHDLAIMCIFYKLGTTASRQEASRLVWILMAMVLAVGIFELLFTATFGDILDVWSYYVNKGVIGQNTVNYSGTNLYLSGDRGALNRTFFPGLLGSHRVSSIFLEPDSLGNYAVIMFAWCMSSTTGTRRARRCLLALSVLCFILSDGRFAAGCCAAMLVIRLTPLIRSRLVVFLMPLMVMVALTITGSLNELQGILPRIEIDNLGGRLLFSARLLDYWHLPQWLGLAPSQVYTADTGYAYVANNLGLPLALLFLALFAMHRPATPEAVVMKSMVSV